LPDFYSLRLFQEALINKLILGEFGSVLLKGQRVIPERLLDQGFRFIYSKIEEALRDILKN